MKDVDGFDVLRCAKCKKYKPASLFSPSMVRSKYHACIRCEREASKRQIRAAKSPPFIEVWHGREKFVWDRRKHKLTPLIGAK